MKTPPKYPRLTPMRAVGLLKGLPPSKEHCCQYEYERIREALENHIKAALVAKKRKAKR